MFRRNTPATLGEYASGYALAHPVRANTLHQYRIAAALFERWAGQPVALETLDERSVAAWLRHLAETRSPATCRSKKVAILALWRAAAEEGACDPPVRKVRVAPVHDQVVEAWDADEVRQILVAAAATRGKHPCGILRAAWWDLAVRVAWDTGLRRGDQFRLAVDSVRNDGTCTIVQSKTGRPAHVRLSPGTFAAMKASVAEAPRKLVTPWAASSETFCQQFKRIVAAAGVRKGTWKWLRRSSASDVEEQCPGEGAAQAGHAPGSRVTAVHYLAPRICGKRRAFPRPL